MKKDDAHLRRTLERRSGSSPSSLSPGARKKAKTVEKEAARLGSVTDPLQAASEDLFGRITSEMNTAQENDTTQGSVTDPQVESQEVPQDFEFNYGSEGWEPLLLP